MRMYKVLSEQGGIRKQLIAEIDVHRSWLEVTVQLVRSRSSPPSHRGLSSVYKWHGRSFECKCVEYYKDLLEVVSFLERKGYKASVGVIRKPSSLIKIDKQLTEERFPRARTQKICTDLEKKNRELREEILHNEKKIAERVSDLKKGN